MLTATGLACGYGTTTICRDIDLAVAAGEVVCLLGPNGSGKTTLFRTLLGLLPAQAGSISIAGQTMSALPRRQIARLIAYVPQAHAGTFPYTVNDMVAMGRTAHLGPFASPGRLDRRAADEALSLLGIEAFATTEYTRLSGGQRQLVLIARALAQEAPVLVMDEPTASLDFGNQALVLAQMARLARSGLAIILSTHAPDHAFAIADRVLLLENGQLIAEGTPRQVLTPQRLASVYGIRVDVETLASGRTVCAPIYDGRGPA